MTISLSAGVRASLLSIQSTAAAAQDTQLRLATGKRVNSALDNPTNFFTSASLHARAGDLSRLQDSMGQAIKTLEAADSGIKGITKLVETAQGIARQAQQSSDNTTRESLRTQFEAIKAQIDQLAGDSGYNGVNLLKDTPDDLTVIFNEDESSSLLIEGQDMSTGSGGMNLTATSANGWDTGTTGVADALGELDTAINQLRTQASTFGANLAVVKNRDEFTRNMINTLKSGGDALVLADSNEEGANLLALQTRGQLAQSALSLASQADQAVVRLFG